MKKIIIITMLLIFSSTFDTNAQIPKGFIKGTVTLNDGITLDGYVKDNMKKACSVTFLDNTGNNKKQYDATQILSVMFNNNVYMCIGSDFFKSICSGKNSLLQKVSNIRGKIIYNGTDPIILEGTKGKIFDYFTHTNNQLVLIPEKKLDSLIQEQFPNCAAAFDRAKASK